MFDFNYILYYIGTSKFIVILVWYDDPNTIISILIEWMLLILDEINVFGN